MRTVTESPRISACEGRGRKLPSAHQRSREIIEISTARDGRDRIGNLVDLRGLRALGFRGRNEKSRPEGRDNQWDFCSA